MSQTRSRVKAWLKRAGLVSFLCLVSIGYAQTTVNAVNNQAWGANLGWINCRGDGANGARIGRYYCSGYVWGANIGWINLGLGSPANGYAYQNNSGTDFGVNTDAAGNLRGYAWGANIGWINFESNGAPRIDLRTGALSGPAYSANCGWISLSNSQAKVVTDALWPGQTDGSGLPLAWEMLNFGTTNISASADPDGDGASNLDEYFAGTNPQNGSDVLSITQIQPGIAIMTLTWRSALTRNYHIQSATDIAGPWTNINTDPIPANGVMTAHTFSNAPARTRFFRVQAVSSL